MKNRHATLAAVLFALTASASTSWAASRTVTLSVPGMDCPVCPITVKKALTGVDGVVKAKVDFEKRLVVVTYDDAKTQVGALTKATTDAGYPSIVKR